MNLLVNAEAVVHDRRSMANSLGKHHLSHTAAAIRHESPNRLQDRVADKMRYEPRNDKSFSPAPVGNALVDLLCNVAVPPGGAAAF